MTKDQRNKNSLSFGKHDFRKKNTSAFLTSQQISDSYELSIESTGCYTHASGATRFQNSSRQPMTRLSKNIYNVGRVFTKSKNSAQNIISPTSSSPKSSKSKQLKRDGSKLNTTVKTVKKRSSQRAYQQSNSKTRKRAFAENKENIPIAQVDRDGQIVIVQKKYRVHNTHQTARKFSPHNQSEDLNQIFSVTGNASEKSISEGLMQNIPDSKIPNNKNKFTYKTVQTLKGQIYSSKPDIRAKVIVSSINSAERRSSQVTTIKSGKSNHHISTMKKAKRKQNNKHPVNLLQPSVFNWNQLKSYQNTARNTTTNPSSGYNTARNQQPNCTGLSQMYSTAQKQERMRDSYDHIIQDAITWTESEDSSSSDSDSDFSDQEIVD